MKGRKDVSGRRELTRSEFAKMTIPPPHLSLRHLLKIHDLAVPGPGALSAKKPPAGKCKFLQGFFARALIPFKGTGGGRAMQKAPRG